VRKIGALQNADLIYQSRQEVRRYLPGVSRYVEPPESIAAVVVDVMRGDT
jgi:hypothetical protein